MKLYQSRLKEESITSDGDGQPVHGVDHVGVCCSVTVRVVRQSVVDGARGQSEAPRPAGSEREPLEVGGAQPVHRRRGGRRGEGGAEVLGGDPQHGEDQAGNLRLGLV